jgi:hypothetical protein
MLRYAGTIWNEFGVGPFATEHFRGKIKFEGPISVKPQYTTQFKEMYAVVTSKHISPTSWEKTASYTKMFSKKETDFSKRGSILFYSAKGKKKPVFILEQCSRAVADLEGNGVLYGVITVPAENEEPEDVFCLLEGTKFPVVTHHTIGNVGTPLDPRPKPEYLYIETTELPKWIVAVMAAFSIDAEPVKENKHFENPEWPSTLYLSLAETGGISMSTPELDSFIYFQHYLTQKSSFTTSLKMQIWCASVAKGEWERKVLDRRETELKLKQMNEWANAQKKKLVQAGFKPRIVDALEIVSRVAEIVPGFAPALMSMVGDVPAPAPSSSSKTDSDSSDDDSHSASDGDGSISDSGSSDGSLSDKESDEEHVKTIVKGQPFQRAQDSDDDGDEEEDSGQAVLYGQNTLLHQLATDGPKTHKHDSGPLINAIHVIVFNFRQMIICKALYRNCCLINRRRLLPLKK